MKKQRYQVTKPYSTKYPNHIQVFDTKKNMIVVYSDMYDFLNNNIYKDKYPNYVHLDVYKISKEHKIKIKVGGWGSIYKCCICGEENISGVLTFDDQYKEICNKCLKSKCVEE